MRYTYNYADTLKISNYFRTLGKLEAEVITYLSTLNSDEDFVGGFTSLTKALGHKPAEITNIRKACRKLEERGLIIIWDNSQKYNQVDAITLNLDWMERVLMEGNK